MFYALWYGVTTHRTKDGGQEPPINEIKHVHKKLSEL